MQEKFIDTKKKNKSEKAGAPSGREPVWGASRATTSEVPVSER